MLAILLIVIHVTTGQVVTPFDEYGNEIQGDRLAEMAAMKSTGLGYGLGARNYYNLSGLVTHGVQPRRGEFHTEGRFLNDHNDHSAFDPLPMTSFPHHLFKRQALESPFSNEIFHKEMFSKDFLAHQNFPESDSISRASDFGSDFQRKFTEGQCEVKTVACKSNKKYRNYDGMCNNVKKPYWGSTMQSVTRMLQPQYMDGVSLPRLHSRLIDPVSGKYPLLPSARLVSRTIHTPSREDIHLPDICNMFQQWGQFVDHDMTGTPVHKGADGENLKCCDGVKLTDNVPFHSDVLNGGPCYPIYIPRGDRHFSSSCMNFARSQGDPKRLPCGLGAREQMNMVTSYLDASSVYSIKDEEAGLLRSYNGGLLKVQNNNLLPADINNKDCVKDSDDEFCFKAGEKRVNEHPGLSTVHTIFHREHNRICGWLQHYNPHWNDETIYQEARRIVGAMLQHITYSEWLPILLGPSLMSQHGLHVDSASSFSGFGPRNWYYDDKQDPRIINSFAAAALRLGHSLVPSRFTVGNERVELRKLFNRPKFVYQRQGQGIDLVGEGLVDDPLQFPDRFINIELTDHLFEDAAKKSMDLASLNINRGRDHGLPPYNDYREVCGLSRLSGFHDLTDGGVYASVYRHVDDVDLFTGGINEIPVSGGLAGPTFGCIISEQFKAIKYGDRYWYENPDPSVGFTPNQLQQIKNVTLSRVMCDATGVGYMQANAFLQSGGSNQKLPCDSLPYMDLSHWADLQKK